MRNLKKKLSNRKINIERLVSFGFVLENNQYIYRNKLTTGNFLVEVIYSENQFFSKIIDLDSNLEYLLVDVLNSTGEFVGRVRDEYDKIINNIISDCSYLDAFKERQSKFIIDYVNNKYHDKLEFLWEKVDNNAVCRNKINNKWYLVFMIIKGYKIDFVTDREIEVINLRYQKDKIDNIIDNKSIFPGFHMNKKSWITIKLDGSIKIDKIYELIDNSYNISLNKK